MTQTALRHYHDISLEDRAVSHRFALLVLCLAQFGVVLAFQGTAISLPEVERSFDLSVSSSQWLISANALAYGGLLLPSGRAADLFGHRRLFILGTALFGVASLAAGFAPTVELLIAARVLQGVGTACFTPAMIALLADIFPDGPERRRALAFWGAAGPAGGVIAILLGGALASAIGWRAVFLLGAPITIAVALLAISALPSAHASTRDRLDPFGALAGALGVGALVYGLSALSNSATITPRSIGWLVLGLVLLAIFMTLERRSASPLVPRSLHHRWRTWLPVSVAFFHGAATNTPIVFYSLFMQHYRDASPWDIGIGFLPCNFAIIAASGAAGRLARSIGYRRVMALGMGIVIAGLVVLTSIAPEREYYSTFLPAWILVGIGLGAAQVGIIGSATENTTMPERGTVGGLVGMAAQIGTAMGLALLVGLSRAPSDEVDGFRAAFVGGAVIAFFGLVIAIAASRAGDARQEA
jgi:MFS family permease